MAEIERNETAHNHTILHLSQLKNEPEDSAEALNDWDDDDNPDNLPEGQDAELLSTAPVMIYLPRELAIVDRKVLRLMPSLSALKDNEVCSITSGNEDDIFVLSGNRGMSSLKFAKGVDVKSVHDVRLTCHPLHNESADISGSLSLDAFDMNLRIFVV